MGLIISALWGVFSADDYFIPKWLWHEAISLASSASA